MNIDQPLTKETLDQFKLHHRCLEHYLDYVKECVVSDTPSFQNHPHSFDEWYIRVFSKSHDVCVLRNGLGQTIGYQIAAK